MKVAILCINPEYSESVPPLTTEEYNSLKESIKLQGQHLPIIVNKDFVILDGHHRFKICEELKLKPKYEIMEFPTLAHEQLFVIDCNRQRRHLNPFSRCVLELKSKLILKKIAKMNIAAHQFGAMDSQIFVNLGRQGVNEKIGKGAQVSHETIRKVDKIIENANKELLDKLRTDKTTINKAYKQIIKEEKKQELLKEKSSINLPETCQLYNMDFRDIDSEIPDNSIDLIFTDPPYGQEAIPFYANLAEFASRKLKDGGSLVTYAGQYALPQIHEKLGKNLKYWWEICVKHGGAHSKMFGRGVYVYWKPLLWYVKGEKPQYTETMIDFIQSAPPEKVLHEWEQSVIEADHVIRKIGVENQIVLDPFLGSGTTGVAALSLNRKFIGIEIDKERFEIAKHRISKVVKEKKL